MNASDDKKESKKASEELEKQNEKKNGLTCWLCEEKHRLMDCHQFKMKPVKDRNDFAAKEKIYKNCFKKTHLLKDCICSIKCCVAVKSITPYCISKAHIKQLIKQDFTKPDKLYSFLQVMPVTVIHGANTTVVNTLLDSGSDTTLITSDLAEILKLKGKQRKLNITSAISKSVSVTSNLVEFSICSTHYLDQIEVKNAWAVDSLNLLSQRISKAEIQRKW